ncbi:MAG: hypothetical protein GY711_04000 [bacterium]|nr:hypothetical protein [bacterium]
MELSHHSALFGGYAVAMAGWILARRWLPRLWPTREPVAFARPWREFGWSVIACVAVLCVGQLYQRGRLLSTEGAWGPGFDTLNQILLYSPMLLLLGFRRHSLESAWLPLRQVPLRLVVGFALALLALAAFAGVRGTLGAWPDLTAFTYRPSHLRFAVHILLEDLTIAILFVRLAAATRHPLLVPVVIAFLFAAGHVPGALADGANLVDLLPLMLDVCLGAGVLLIVSRSADIWWFWCVHFALDMTQFWGS